MLSEEKKAIEYFKRRIANKKTDYTSIYFKIEKLELLLNLIEEQQAEIEKKDKIIDEMADKLSEYTCWNKDDLNMNKLAPIDDIIEYFTNKVEKEYNNE